MGTHMSQAELREKAVNTAAAISQVGICVKQSAGNHMSQAELREKAVNIAAAISQVGICGKQEKLVWAFICHRRSPF